MRRYIWSHLDVAGEPLRYLGTGGEIFRGLVKVTGLFFIIGAISGVVLVAMGVSFKQDYTQLSHEELLRVFEKCGYDEQEMNELSHEAYGECLEKHTPQTIETSSHPILVEALNLIPVLIGLYLLHFARYSALRYRLTRTTWRGIRSRLTGSAHGYTRFALMRDVINLITLGILIPQSDMKKQQYITSDMQIGNQSASFTADTQGLRRVHLITWILALPTLWFSRLWYRAALKNKKLANTSLGSVTLTGTYTGKSYFMLYIINLLLIIVTLGLAMPAVLQRTLRFHTNNIIVGGDIQSSQIMQTSDMAGNVGEGVQEEFDSGIDLDIGFI